MEEEEPPDKGSLDNTNTTSKHKRINLYFSVFVGKRQDCYTVVAYLIIASKL